MISISIYVKHCPLTVIVILDDSKALWTITPPKEHLIDLDQSDSIDRFLMGVIKKNSSNNFALCLLPEVFLTLSEVKLMGFHHTSYIVPDQYI